MLPQVYNKKKNSYEGDIDVNRRSASHCDLKLAGDLNIFVWEEKTRVESGNSGISHGNVIDLNGTKRVRLYEVILGNRSHVQIIVLLERS